MLRTLLGSETNNCMCLCLRAGDSACSIPPQTIAQECLDVIRDWTPKLAKALKVVGLINIQYCVQDNQVRWYLQTLLLAYTDAPTPFVIVCKLVM